MRKLLLLLGIVAILLFSGCTSAGEREKSDAISEMKGWINPLKIDIDDWQAFENPKGEGIVVIGSNSGAWCGESNCTPEVYLIAYLVNVEKPHYEKICALNELGLLSLDPTVTNGKVSYCENLDYADIQNLIE